MYRHIMKLFNQAIGDQYILLDAYKNINERLEKENKQLREQLAKYTETEGSNNEKN